MLACAGPFVQVVGMCVHCSTNEASHASALTYHLHHPVLNELWPSTGQWPRVRDSDTDS